MTRANPAKAGDAKPRVLVSSATLHSHATKDSKIAELPIHGSSAFVRSGEPDGGGAHASHAGCGVRSITHRGLARCHATRQASSNGHGWLSGKPADYEVDPGTGTVYVQTGNREIIAARFP